MGFFNQSEIISIQNGLFSKDALFDTRIITSLNKVVFSQTEIKYNCRTISVKKSVKKPRKKPRKTKRTTCSVYKIFTKSIKCTNVTQLLFADCLNATSLVFSFRYYYANSITYNCQVKNGSTCISNCTQLINSDYSLLMLQQIDNQVQSTWTNLSDCNRYISRKILVNLSIPSCSLESRGDKLRFLKNSAFFSFILNISLMFL